MNPSANDSGIVILPGQSRVVRAYGDEVHFHLTGEQTSGSFTLFTDITPPGGGPPPHYHQNEDELFFVLEGRVEFLKDGQWFEVGVGGTVYIPKGVLHTFRNLGEQPSKLLIRTSPAGFEIFLRGARLNSKKPTVRISNFWSQSLPSTGFTFPDWVVNRA